MTPEELQQKNDDLLKRRASERKDPDRVKEQRPAHTPNEYTQDAYARLKPIEDKRADAYVSELQSQERLKRIAKIWKACGLGERHRNKVELDMTGKWGGTYETIKAKIGKGFTMAIIGDRGTGKTQLAARLVRYAVAHERQTLYVTAPAMFMELERAIRRDSIFGKIDLMRKFCRYRFLVIDEIGRRSENPWEENFLFELLDSQYRELHDTLMISNQDQEAFEKSIGVSIVSRMNETGGIIDAKISDGWKCFR